MSWRKTRLADVASMKTGKLNSNAAVDEGAYPFFTCAQETLRIDKPAFDTEAVLLGGNNAAGVFPLKYYSGAFNAYQRTYIIESLNAENLETRFLYYALRPALGHFQSASIGAATQYLTKGILDNFRVSVPLIDVQRRIVSTLSAYDDLIENNRRRIQLLEQAARLLYKEWFVHLRFPGHEHVTITDGVPEGWEIKSISELADVFRGKSYKSSELIDEGGQPFINLKCFERGGGFRVSGLKWFLGEHKEHHQVRAGDIVIAVTDLTRDAMIVAHAARVPRTVGENPIYSMDVVKVVPKGEVDPNWFYGMLRFSRFSAEVREEATGATVLHLKPKYIENWSALVPPRVLRDVFSEQFGAILAQADNLELQNQKITRARDLLLPRLMNGEIAV